MNVEDLIHELGKDVAVMAETQKAFQKNQERTTTNINSLAGTVDKLTKEAVRLEAIFNTVVSIEGRVKGVESLTAKRAEVVLEIKHLRDYNKGQDKRLDKIESILSKWFYAVSGTIVVGVIGTIFKFVTGG